MGIGNEDVVCTITRWCPVETGGTNGLGSIAVALWCKLAMYSSLLVCPSALRAAECSVPGRKDAL